MATGTIKHEIAFPVADFAKPKILRITITREFDAYFDGEGIAYTARCEYGPEVEIEAGGMLLFQDSMADLTGWLLDEVEAVIKDKGYTFDEDEARDEIESAADREEFIRSHAAGRV